MIFLKTTFGKIGGILIFCLIEGNVTRYKKKLIISETGYLAIKGGYFAFKYKGTF